MSHFAAAEADGDFDPVAIGQETLGVADLNVEIIDVDSGGHTHFFDLHDPLVFLCLLIPLGLLETVLAVVHELADGGDGVGGNFHQVQVGVAGLCQGFGQGHDAKLFPLGGDEAYFLVVNFLVDLMSRVSYDGRTSSSEKSNKKWIPAKRYPHNRPTDTQFFLAPKGWRHRVQGSDCIDPKRGAQRVRQGGPSYFILLG